MEESQSQSQSPFKYSHQGLRLHARSNVEPHVIYSSSVVTNANSAAGSNSARYKLMSPAKLPISRSACINVPSAAASTSFLESPVLLSNIKVEPSPTTGSLFKHQLIHGSGGTAAFSLATSCPTGGTFDERKTSRFEFKLHSGCHFAPGLPSVSTHMNHQRSESLEQIQEQCQPQSFASLPSVKSEMAAASKELNLSAPVQIFTSRASVPAGVDSDELSQRGHSNTGFEATHSDEKDIGHSIIAERSFGDGYNWRKYGQKLVKGSEFPRSYYKCTHPNCEVKKIFERSYDGQITEMVYKGTHDHPKPQPTRRFTAGAIMSIQEKADKISSLTSQDNRFTLNPRNSYNVEPNGSSEILLCGENDESVPGAVSQLKSINDEVDKDDSFSKRRKIDDGGGIDVTPVVRPIREPRVIVQTVSEVDILDDGYRWRKYGQKVVRGNPNPRSYYKCTNAGCQVRKHVERASHDPKAVITTYEGKHNHDVPTERTSSHDMAGPAAAAGMSRIRADEKDSISLNLGVGNCSSAENRSLEQQRIWDAEPFQYKLHNTSSDFKVVQVTPVSTYHVVNGDANPAENSRFETLPLKHSSNPYFQNLGRILL